MLGVRIGINIREHGCLLARPSLKRLGDPVRVHRESGFRMNSPTNLRRLRNERFVALAKWLEKGLPHSGQRRPVSIQRFDICGRYAPLEMRLDILHILAHTRIDVTGHTEIVAVLILYFAPLHESRVMRLLTAVTVGGNDFLDIALAQTILVAVLYEAAGSIDHKNALALVGS